MKFGLERWNVGRELSSLQREMDRFFDQFTSQVPQTFSSKPVDFVPPCDIEETDNQYQLKIDVPGFKRDNLKLEIAEHVLTVSGEYREEKTDEKKNRRVTERAQGYFERSFRLPQSTDAGKVEAHYAEGVLHITVPKAAAVTATKQIPIGDTKPLMKGSAPKEKESSAQAHKAA